MLYFHKTGNVLIGGCLMFLEVFGAISAVILSMAFWFIVAGLIIMSTGYEPPPKPTPVCQCPCVIDRMVPEVSPNERRK